MRGWNLELLLMGSFSWGSLGSMARTTNIWPSYLFGPFMLHCTHRSFAFRIEQERLPPVCCSISLSLGWTTKHWMVVVRRSNDTFFVGFSIHVVQPRLVCIRVPSLLVPPRYHLRWNCVGWHEKDHEASRNTSERDEDKDQRNTRLCSGKKRKTKVEAYLQHRSRHLVEKERRVGRKKERKEREREGRHATSTGVEKNKWDVPRVRFETHKETSGRNAVATSGR